MEIDLVGGGAAQAIYKIQASFEGQEGSHRDKVYLDP
jgi:hypothetical protein